MKISNIAWLALISLPLGVLGCSTTPDDQGSNDDSSQLEGTDDSQEPKTKPATVNPDQNPQGSDPEKPGHHSLAHRYFNLDHAVGYTLVEGSSMYMMFTSDRIKFSPGGNDHIGEYTVDGATLIVSNLGHWAVGYGQALAAQDSWFREFIGSEPRVEVDESGMVLSDGTVSFVFVDQGLPGPIHF